MSHQAIGALVELLTQRSPHHYLLIRTGAHRHTGLDEWRATIRRAEQEYTGRGPTLLKALENVGDK